MTTFGRQPDYDRTLLIDILVWHPRLTDSRCGCGWTKPGGNHPRHIIEVYEASMAARYG